MPHTEERVRLRKPCPCGQGQVLLIFHLPTPDGESGYFLSPEIVCAACVSLYRAHYRAAPDRVELSPFNDEEHPSSKGTITYPVEPVPPPRPGTVDHA